MSNQMVVLRVHSLHYFPGLNSNFLVDFLIVLIAIFEAHFFGHELLIADILGPGISLNIAVDNILHKCIKAVEHIVPGILELPLDAFEIDFKLVGPGIVLHALKDIEPAFPDDVLVVADLSVEQHDPVHIVELPLHIQEVDVEVHLYFVHLAQDSAAV